MQTGETLTRVFLVRRTLLTPLLPDTTKGPVTSPKSLNLPSPTDGRVQVGKRWEKGVELQRSFKTPSKSSAADPLG